MSEKESRRSSDHAQAEAAEGIVLHWPSAYELLAGRFLRRTHAAVANISGLVAGESVIDVGCGTGSLALSLKGSADSTTSVCGVDASPEMIGFARRRAHRAGLEVDFRVGLAQALPFGDAEFDLAVSQLVMHHLPGDLKRRCLAEIYRVLKPCGRCLIVDLQPPETPVARMIASLILGHTMMQTDVRDYRAIMEEVGFTGVEVGRTPHRMLAFVKGRAAKLS